MEDRESLKDDCQNLEGSQLKSKRPFFSCSLCHGKYKSPKVLSCWHSFCLECLTNYVPDNSISVICPVCNIPCILPKQGVDCLPDNWMLTSMKDGKSPSVDLLTIKTSSRMLDTIDGNDFPGDELYICENNNNNNFEYNNFSSNHTSINNTFHTNNDTLHTTSNSFQISDNIESASTKHSEDDSESPTNNHSLSKYGHPSTQQHYHDLQCDTASSSAIVMDESLTAETSQSAFFSQSYRSSSESSHEKLYCRLHSLQNLELYCQLCDVAICIRCSEQGHYQHAIVSIDSAIQSQKSTLLSLLEQLKNESKDTENDRNFIESVKCDLEYSFTKVKDQINSRYKHIVNLLQKKLNTNLQELDTIYGFRNDLLDKQLACINENFENIQLSYDLAEKILDSERSELILLANKCYAIEDYSGEPKQTSFKQHSSSLSSLSRPVESSFVCFDPEGYENLEKYSSFLSGIVSDKNHCSNMISFSTEDLSKPINLNRKFKLAIYLIEDNPCIVNDYISRLNSAIYAFLYLPNGRKKTIEFIKDMSDNELGHLIFTPEHIGVHVFELYNFGVLVRGTPIELIVSKFPLASNISSNHFNNYATPKAKNTISKRPITQNPFQPKIKSSSSTFLNKSIPSKQPQNSFVTKTFTKPSHMPAQRQQSTTSLSRPPWNNSVTKNAKMTSSNQPLRRSLSSTVPRNELSHRLSNNSLHKLDKTAKLSARISSHPVMNNSFKDRFTNDCKMNLQKIIDEEEDAEAHGLEEEASENKNHLYIRVNSRELNKTLPTTQTPDSKPKRKVTTFSHSQPRVTRPLATSNKLTTNKITSSKTSLKPPNEAFKRFGTKGKLLGEFNSLQDVAFHNGLILGSDAKNQCIQMLDFKTGKFTKQIILGEGLDKPPSPSGLAVDSTGYVYVSDLENHCVVVLNPKGRMTKKIGQGYLKGPKGLALSDKELVVADMKGCSVHVYDKSSGELLGRFGSQGYKDENLCSPQFCAITPDQQSIIVSDFRTDKVKVFSWKGQLLKCFGGTGTRLGHLSGPTGVAVHPSTGNIYVCDFSNTRIQVFSKEGLFVEKLSLSLSAPQGLCFIDDGRMMVADAGNHCIKITEIKKNQD